MVLVAEGGVEMEVLEPLQRVDVVMPIIVYKWVRDINNSFGNCRPAPTTNLPTMNKNTDETLQE
jgi:hypothetical protein